MTTQRKLVKGKKHNKNSRKKISKISKSIQKGGQEKKNNTVAEIDIDDQDDLLLNDFDNNENKSAKIGAYNKNESEDELTGIAKKLQEEQGGLSLQYPGEVNITQEQALKDKLNNVREEGFPGLNISPNSQFKPKINYQKMYESDLLSAQLVIPRDEFNTNSKRSQSSEQVN